MTAVFNKVLVTLFHYLQQVFEQYPIGFNLLLIVDQILPSELAYPYQICMSSIVLPVRVFAALHSQGCFTSSTDDCCAIRVIQIFYQEIEAWVNALVKIGLEWRSRSVCMKCYYNDDLFLCLFLDFK